jgi:hypothetical protein
MSTINTHGDITLICGGDKNIKINGEILFLNDTNENLSGFQAIDPTTILTLENANANYLLKSNGRRTNASYLDSSSSDCFEATQIFKNTIAQDGTTTIKTITLDNSFVYIKIECSINGANTSGVMTMIAQYFQSGEGDATINDESTTYIGTLDGGEVVTTVTAKSVNINLVGNIATGDMVCCTKVTYMVCNNS